MIGKDFSLLDCTRTTGGGYDISAASQADTFG
jgi:hypothetical protein